MGGHPIKMDYDRDTKKAGRREYQAGVLYRQ